MEVIWHNHELIHQNMGKGARNSRPFVANDLASRVQYHLTIDNITEEAMPTLGADGYEIGTGTAVVMVGQPD